MGTTITRLHDDGLVAVGLLGLAAVATGIVAGAEPALAVAAILGLIFTALAFVNLTAGIIVLAVLSFLEVSPLGIEGLSLTKAAGALLVLSLLARIASHPGESKGRILFSAHPLASYALLLLLGWSALSVIWAENSSAAVDAVIRWALVLSLYVIVFTAVRSRREAGWVIGTFVAGCAVTATWGLISTPDFDTSGRLASTVGDSNTLAAILICGMALGAAVYLSRRGPAGLRLAAAFAVAVCLIAFLLTGSRGGVVALFAVLAAFVVIAGRGRRALALAGVVFIAVMGITYFAAFAPPDVRDRIVLASQGNIGESEARPTLWKIGWRMVEDEPISGVGAGNFEANATSYLFEPGVLNRTDRIVDDPAVAHNVYLQALAELGVVGFLLLAGIFLFSVRCALQAAREAAQRGDRQFAFIAAGLFLAILGFLVVNLFISETYSKLLWLLLGLGPALLAVTRESAAAQDVYLRPARVGESATEIGPPARI